MPEGVKKSTRQKSVAIISKPDRPELAQALPPLYEWLEKHSYRLMVDRESAQYAAFPNVVPRREPVTFSPDLALVLGGYGPLLPDAGAGWETGALVFPSKLGKSRGFT